MTAQRSGDAQPLTDLQRAVVQRARKTPFVVSRTYRRTAPGTDWIHEPFTSLSDDIDILDVLDMERESMIAETSNPEQRSMQ